MGKRNGPPIWYWEVEPAKTIYERFEKVQHLLECWNPNCFSIGKFCRDSNGTGMATYACIKCSTCTKKIRASKFFTRVMKGSENDPILKLEKRRPLSAKSRNHKKIPAIKNIDLKNADKKSSSELEETADEDEDFYETDESDQEMTSTKANLPSTSGARNTANLPANYKYAHPSMGAAKYFELSEEFKKECPEAVAKNPIPEHSEEEVPKNQPEDNQIQVESSDEEFPESRYATRSETEEVISALTRSNAAQDASKKIFRYDIPDTNKRRAQDVPSSDEVVTKSYLEKQMESFLTSIKSLVNSSAKNATRIPPRHAKPSGQITSLGFFKPTAQAKGTVTEAESTDILALKKENDLLKAQISSLTAKIDQLIRLQIAQDNRNKGKTPSVNSLRTNSQPSVLLTTSGISAQFSSQPPTKPRKPTFAEIAKSQVKTGSEAEITKYEEALRRIAGINPLGTGTKAEENHKVARIYIQGISRQPIRDVKSSMFLMKFRLSKIWNMDFIGKSTAEFTVSADYAAAFISRTKSFPFLTVLPKVDPSKPMNIEATLETKKNIRAAFHRRIVRSLENTKNPLFQAYLKDLAAESRIPVDLTKIPNLAEENQTTDEILVPELLIENDTEITKNADEIELNMDFD
ncbi:hypothetical protein BB558_002802 [Smittium angustum]|uniref:Uncharacterized protein n=2 Tax=Smittium angustum TaxID=133377 RepID=A0A2U1J7X2_SMIAN|nr:hypothetical protein BB558_002802 [Smittium angustum]